MQLLPVAAQAQQQAMSSSRITARKAGIVYRLMCDLCDDVDAGRIHGRPSASDPPLLQLVAATPASTIDDSVKLFGCCLIEIAAAGTIAAD
jgi:hypothetical protein